MKVADGTISLELLKQRLQYDPETGVWTYRIQRRKYRAGSVAGRSDKDGYTVIISGGKNYRSARLAWFYMTGSWPAETIDHKDTNPKNDKWDNLRLATPSQNSANRRAHSNNPLGVKGVAKNGPRDRPYAAQIRMGGKTCRIGVFPTIEEASAAYLQAAREIYGEFARA